LGCNWNTDGKTPAAMRPVAPESPPAASGFQLEGAGEGMARLNEAAVSTLAAAGLGGAVVVVLDDVDEAGAGCGTAER
jgi:hypothetical protein